MDGLLYLTAAADFIGGYDAIVEESAEDAQKTGEKKRKYKVPFSSDTCCQTLSLCFENRALKR